MDVKERQRLRNQVSAQQSRIKKKAEVIKLNKTLRKKNENTETFLEEFFSLLGESE